MGDEMEEEDQGDEGGGSRGGEGDVRLGAEVSVGEEEEEGEDNVGVGS